MQWRIGHKKLKVIQEMAQKWEPQTYYETPFLKIKAVGLLYKEFKNAFEKLDRWYNG